MKKLSSAAHNIEGQPMFKLLAKVQELERQGKNIIHFEIGDPDFNTPDNIIDAAVSSLKRGEVHYTSSLGLNDMRMAACDATENSRGFRPDIEQVLITPGANIIIYYVVRCVVELGDEVIVPNPGFPTYYSVLKFCGVLPVAVQLKEENEFRMNPGDIEKKITKKTRLIIINSPQNPSGSVMTKEELDRIYDIAEKHDVYLLCDEVYARMIYEGEKTYYSPSMRDKCRERVILTNGFSKSFAMTGWRLGCVIAPEDLISRMGLLLQTTSSCVSPFIQRAGIEAIKGPQGKIKEMVEEYRMRRDILVEGLNKIWGIKCLNPGGAFYVFPNITGTGMSDEQFSQVMLDKAGVALLPGSNFGEFGRGYVRLCYATSRENIKEGINRISEYFGSGRIY